MKTLTELAEQYKSDKRMGWHGYTDIYDSFMDPDATAVLEIGIFNGASIRMWLDFFPNARVYGVDIDSNCVRNMQGIDRLTVIEADQKDEDIWETIEPLDYVIDDGSHYPDDILQTLWNGFSRLKPGGVWIIEDTHCSFHERFNPTMKDILYPFFFDKIIKQQTANLNDHDFYRNRETYAIPGSLEWLMKCISFTRDLIMIERGND